MDPDIKLLTRDLKEDREVKIGAADVAVNLMAGIEIGDARGQLGGFNRQLGEGPLPAIGCRDPEILDNLGVAGVVPVLEPGDDSPVDSGLARGVDDDDQGVGLYRLFQLHGSIVVHNTARGSVRGLGLAGLDFHIGFGGHNTVGTVFGGEVAGTDRLGTDLLEEVVGGT